MSTRLNGVVAIDLNDLERIAEYLQVDITDLLPARPAAHAGSLTTFMESLPRAEGRVLPAPTRSPVTPAYEAAPNGQATKPTRGRPKDPVRPPGDKPNSPASSRRPGRVKSTARLAYA
jgi:hypothetical protein